MQPRVASLSSRRSSWIRALCALAASGLFFLLGAWLAVRLAVGGDTLVVPDVTGRPVAEAERVLAEAGMSAEIDEERVANEQLPADAVARQDPAAGTPVKRVRIVRLMLASGPRERRLPSVVGDSRARAVIALGQEGYEVEFIAVVPSREAPRDTILAQEPEPAELPPGTTAPLRLLTSAGPPAVYYVTPNLIGRPVDLVRPRLEAHGFRVSEGPNRRVVPNVAPGTIVAQQPQPGFKLLAGGEIILQVSR